MTKDEALKLALEALVLNNAEWKALADSGDAGFWEAEEQDHYKQTEQAITAIKEALSQPEPCEYCYGTGDVHSIDGEWRGVCICKAGKALAQPEQLMSDQINYGMSVTQGGKRIDPMSIYKEPEQEPVAEVDDWRDSIFTRYVEYLPSGTRLYTTPLEPKPMTDEEIDKMCPKFEDPMRREMWIIGFKAAHGIKELA